MFSKILEKLIYNKLFRFLVRYQILFKSQYGFRKGHNTTQATLDFLQTIEAALKEGDMAIGVFIDLSKAFDTLDHDTLLMKLEHYGIRENWLSWFRSYLSNRKQFVEFDGVRSQMKDITVGVPQGSILGPLLFLVYINDLPACCNKMLPVMFADDTNLVIRGNDYLELTKILNDELASLYDYFCANKLKLNASKTQLVCFRKKGQNFDPQNIPVKIDNQSLNFTDHVTFLGLILDEHLTWENHCNNVANKIARTCGVLNRVKKVLPLHSLLAIYHSLVQSHYSYGLEVWGASSAKSIKRINILQKKSIRSVTRAHWLAHSEPRLKKFEILKIADQHKLQTVSLVYDMLRGYSPDIFKFQLSLNINQNDINLRSSVAQPNNLRPPHRTRMSDQKFFSYCAIENWNSLPNEIKQCSSRKSFKSSAKKHYLSTYLTECNCINPLCIDLLHHSD